MNIDFYDESNQFRLFLCQPDRTTVAELRHVKQRKLTENYGGINQLTFTIPFKIPSDEGKQIINPAFFGVRGDYLIRMEKGDSKDYYIISNPESNIGSDGGESKTVVCHQLQYEWKDKLVRNFKGTFLLYDPVGVNGVLNKTLLSKTDWSVDYIDSSLLNKYRTFDVSERNLLEFVLDSIERYGSYIPIYDTVNKKISIYLDENIGTFEGLEVTYGKYLKSLNESENFDDICTRLYMYGKDISINSLNPSGTDYLESFDFYMFGFEEDASGNVVSHSRYMSDSLCKAIKRYNTLLESKSGVFQGYLDQKQGYQSTRTAKQNELHGLQDELKLILDSIDVAIAANQDLTNLNNQKANKQNQINNKQTEINNINASIAALNSQISTLHSQISIENNFTPIQIKERNRFIKEKTWSDSNYTKVEDLYNEGKARLLRLSQPQVVYKTDVIDVIQNLNVPYDRHKVKLGANVKITYPNLDIDLMAKIIMIDHDIDGNNLQLTIANTKDIKSGIVKIKDLLNRSVNTSTQVDMSRFKWDLSESNNTEIDRIINNKWDAAKQAVVGGKNENVVVSDRGITMTNITNPLKMLRMLSSTIAMSSDGGNTYKLAIDASGVVAESLYGKIIAGNNLTIQNSSGSVAINSQGITVTDMILNIITSNGKNKISVSGDAGFKIQKNNGTVGNPIWSDLITLDSNTGDALFSGNVAIGSGNSIFKADSYGIYLGSTNFSSAPFRVTPSGAATVSNINVTGGTFSIGGNFSVDSAGILTAYGANISGNITANAIAANTSITSPTINGGNITGSLFKTSNSGRRIEFDFNGLRTYDNNNINRIKINTVSDSDVSAIIFYGSGGTQVGHINSYQTSGQLTMYGDNIFIGSNNTANPVYIQASTTMNGSASIYYNLTVQNINILDRINSLKDSVASLENSINYLQTQINDRARKGTATSSTTVAVHNHGFTSNDYFQCYNSSGVPTVKKQWNPYDGDNHSHTQNG